jgi:hypothetical protein
VIASEDPGAPSVDASEPSTLSTVTASIDERSADGGPDGPVTGADVSASDTSADDALTALIAELDGAGALGLDGRATLLERVHATIVDELAALDER